MDSKHSADGTKKLKWYSFSQNNSGGSFVVNDEVSHFVFVQAYSAAQARELAEKLLDNSDSCPCCGDRWSFWIDESDGNEEPMIYGKPYTEYSSMWVTDFARLHHLDGRIEAYPVAAAGAA